LPVAAITLIQQGRTISVDATSSRDPDGHIIDYLWDFGDGTTMHGAKATHTYQSNGDYLTSLAVTDDRGGMGFTAAAQVVSLRPYPFTGFAPPIVNPPAVNTVTAGQAIPIKFSL